MRQHAPRRGSIWIVDTRVDAVDETGDAAQDEAVGAVWYELRAHLWRERWRLRIDCPSSVPSGAYEARLGRKGPLDLAAQRVGSAVAVELFQHGGRLAFDRFRRMDIDRRTLCALHMVGCVRRFQALGYTLAADQVSDPAEPLEAFVVRVASATAADVAAKIARAELREARR